VSWLRSWGTELYTEDGKKALLNEPKAREAFTYMYGLMHERKVAVTGTNFTSQAEELMIADRVAMLQGASSLKSMPAKIGSKFEVKNTLMPPGPAGKVGTQTNTDHIVINARTQNKEAAWELVKLMCGKEVGVRLGGGTGGIASGTCGGRIDVFHDPRIMANPLHPVWIPLVEQATPPIYPANLREEEVAATLHQVLAPLWLGERKPDAAFFDEVNAAVQTVMDRPPA
jgi:ABC-type glycerol-3-phosphate transport system substrate-binding protein